jgi:hypothetical protein
MFNDVVNPYVRNAFMLLHSYSKLTRWMLLGLVPLVLGLMYSTHLIVQSHKLGISAVHEEVKALKIAVGESETQIELLEEALERSDDRWLETARAHSDTRLLQEQQAQAITELGEQVTEMFLRIPEEVQSEQETAAFDSNVAPEIPVVEVQSDCHVGVNGVSEMNRLCVYEERSIAVAFYIDQPPFPLIWNDKETARLDIVQWLWGSALTETSHVNRTAEMQLLLHLDNEIGSHQLPEIDFGIHNNTWLLDVTSLTTNEEILTQGGGEDWSGNRYVTVLNYGDVVEILIEEESRPADDGTWEKVFNSYYVSVVMRGEGPEIVFLNAEVNKGFQRAGVSVYVGPTACGEGGSCLSMFTHQRFDDRRNSVFVWSKGDSSGSGMTVAIENVSVSIMETLEWRIAEHSVRIPEFRKVR